VIAVLPVALTFLAATFVGAMFARSFKGSPSSRSA